MRRPAIDFGPAGGQAVLLVVVAMSIFMIGAIGLAIDGGQMYAQRQMAQAAADAAAGAGALSIMNGTNATSTYTFGTGATPIASYVCTTMDGRTPCVYARDNGFGATASDTVTLSYPATVSGVAFSSVTVPALTVTVQRTLNNGLIRFVGGPAHITISAKATSGITATVPTTCIYTLDPSAANAFSATNGASVALSGCAVAVDSTSVDAATVSGGSSVTASAIDITGGVVISGGGTTTPVPVTGAPAVADPFASLPAPAVGACNFTNFSPGYGTWTLTPGTYCGGITISNGSTATFNSGTYILNGGGLTLIGGTTSNGSGVMFYFTGTNASYGSATISNGATVTFSGPASGPYTGILFFQDRTITSGNNAVAAGGASMNLTGSLYFPTTYVSFSNGAGAAGYTAIVAKQVSFTGGTKIQYDPTGLKTGLSSKSMSMVQ